ncbi:MAG: hypothetical protein EA392_09605 [Cryomorphaceae bacterium]|nr:MAG: hypothetical protein EA392_09605 [Cryomorphaceae bacterium]
MPRPGIQVFNQNGEMLNELCHAHFGNDEKLVKSVEQLRNRPMRSGKNPFKLEEGKNLFDILEHEQVNGKEVLDRLPRDVDRYLLIPWKVKDTVMDPGTGIVPHEDWIKPVLIVAEESDLKFAVLWESMHLTTAQGITKEEYGHLYFDAMQAQFPKQFLEDEEADTVR